MGEAFLIQRGSAGGAKVNGTLASYTVASGKIVTAGQFVALSGTSVYPATSADAMVVGIAKQKGTSGATIKVYVP